MKQFPPFNKPSRVAKSQVRQENRMPTKRLRGSGNVAMSKLTGVGSDPAPADTVNGLRLGHDRWSRSDDRPREV